MVRYWPTKRSIYLNNTVVELFINTEKKIYLKEYNNSNQYLYIDALNLEIRSKLFICIISELKKLILDIIEIDLDLEKINQLKSKINQIFLKNVFRRFLEKINYKGITNLLIDSINKINHDKIIYLIIYFTMGSSKIDHRLFIFEPIYTPYNHVKILLEDFIIQAANETIRKLFSTLGNSPKINSFLKEQSICNRAYLSNRSTILLLNNLKYQYFLQKNLHEVRDIYSERKQILILSSRGVIAKYIQISNVQEINKFNKFKAIFVIWLEFKDLIIPKIEKLVVQIAKYLLYSSLNLINNILVIIIKGIVFYIKN
uniref:Uncharacterized protein n=1 Tax=Polysiphonia sertularioides TaxID=945028 RepID=A0A1Z1MGK3_9FLOR|nr:hypothetical protein [Polysiphonia sertularioides]